MCQMELSDEEQGLLAQLLQQSLMSLEIELRHTDHLEFKQVLKRRREVLESLIAKLPRSPASAD